MPLTLDPEHTLYFHCFVASRARGVRVMISDGAGGLSLVM